MRSLVGSLQPTTVELLALAAAVPEFAPYAKMDESDIGDCHVNVN